MPRKITIHQEIERLQPHEDRRNDFKSYVTAEVEDAFSARTNQEAMWRECFRMYDAVPRVPVKNTPIENAPNIEIPIGMMATDIFYSISLQTIFNASPLVSTKIVPGREELAAHVKAMGNFVNWGIRNEFGARVAAEHSFLDNIQLGTGMFYIPWIEHRKKTKVHKIVSSHPEIQPWPIEDVIIPGGSFQDIQTLPMVGLRQLMTEHQLLENAKSFNWDISDATPVGTVGWVRSRREQLGRTFSNRKIGILYEIMEIYVYYDIDGDGFQEDLLITYDRTSRSILRMRFNPYDHRPLSPMQYQKRAFLFYGMGILEKLKSIQEEVSNIHNHRVLNMLLANTRMWKVSRNLGLPDTFKIWPGRVIKVDQPTDIQGEQLGDVYTSSFSQESQTLQIGAQLVGLNEMTGPKPSQLLSSRTPATTAQLGFSQSNQRFAASFDSERDALGHAIVQCLWRYQERVKAGDQNVIDHIVDVMGPQQGRFILESLASPGFEQNMDLELTATNERTLRQVEQNNLIQLGQILLQYYERVIQLSMIAANDQAPSPVREIAKKIATASGEWVERTMRSFDTIRDPKSFLVNFNEQIDQLQQVTNSSTMGQLEGLLAGLDQAEGNGGNPALDNF